jgi:solute carrier family 50 (sugar transporter)
MVMSHDEVHVSYLFFQLICPCIGSLLATAMFAAPISDLREALQRQSLGPLNPRPWAVMSGNCLGWIAYGYYTHNIFIVMSNLPGLILSVWLNSSASQLEYHQACVVAKPRDITGDGSGRGGAGMRSQILQHRDGDEQHPSHSFRSIYFDDPVAAAELAPTEGGDGEGADRAGGYRNTLMPIHRQPSPPPLLTHQLTWWMRVLSVWAILLLWAGWLTPWPGTEAVVVGSAVNLNLIFFYGAPLQSIHTVLRKGSSESIHSG